MDHNEHEQLRELAERYGIASDYHDIWGHRHETPDQTRRAILEAMGVRVESPDALRRALADCADAPWRQVCDPVHVVRADEPAGCWSVRMPAQEQEDRGIVVSWDLRDESGAVRQRGRSEPGAAPAETRTVDGLRHVRVELPVPAGLPIGYYDMMIKGVSESRQVEGVLRLIVAPAACHLLPEFQDGHRLWGLAVQLYTLRSARNWGAGDFSDLNTLVEWAAKDLRAGLIGLNPLHALNNTRPFEISPYSPTNRLFLNMLYLDIETIPEYQLCESAQQTVQDAGFQRALAALRAGGKVDYDQVSAAKWAVLELLWTTFHERHLGGRDLNHRELKPATERGRAFARYVEDEDEPLEMFALFQSLAEEMRRQHPLVWAWREWPEPYRSPLSASVAAFRVTHRARIRFHQYVQWLAAEQLGAVAARARALGMPVGLYHDLALGSDRNGSEAWTYQDVLALDADCGCPPDAFAPQGQNWGLPPANPVRLRATGYRMFIELLRHNLTYGGALRLDHVMGLFRLFWIPRGMPASAGAYVRYPVEDLLGILALESVRHRAVIIGEDLGTVPDGVRERLAAARVLSYRVLYFERIDQGDWKAPEAYPSQAMAVVTTHDLPTLAGFWAARDIDVRAGLGLYADSGAVQRAREERQQQKQRIVRALGVAGLLPADVTEESVAVQPMTPELCQAVHVFLARTPSWAVLANLEDLLGETDQTNVPGTVEGYQNWSRKIALPLERLRDDPRVHRLASAMRALRPLPQQG
ncbi:MAG: 4-alpha-glucanotransferase [Nitrospirae bacterium RIFCSPLOWO2_02_FULL_62_14]|nr:MAG: 4-alpha-glucanotransferase [Nitrospirae bacterium RIFCSPLOWO2_02_FULL_62_14]